MTNTRFTVQPAVVGQFNDEYVGWFILDSFTGHAVRDGKGGFIHVWGSRVALVVDICEEMNNLTEGIRLEDSASLVPTDTELSALFQGDPWDSKAA